MKVETPQILWNSDDDKGKNAPLYSISMLESGIADDKSSQIYGNVLATAGNTSVINLWKICFIGDTEASTSIFQKQKSLTKIEYLTSLARHELPVNTVSFSPDGLHLVTAGEAGNLVIWSVPVAKRGNGNGRHFWSTITKETDLSIRIVSTHCEGVCDISWSGDSKRFVVGTIDACVLVFEDKNFHTNHISPDTHQKSSDWTVVFRSGHDHSQFVQGVAFDPLGAYVATMSSDRTVRVFPRKAPPKGKKKVLRPSNAKGPSPPPEHKRMVDQLLTDAKLELGKSKQLKHRTVTIDETGAQIKQKMFADESTCESFFRRLNWTSDGAFLIAPAALWHEAPTDAASGKPSISPPSFSTYLFARHRYDEPYRVLSGLEKVRISQPVE
jgi:chromatin assembly factor 1 subunit B